MQKGTENNRRSTGNVKEPGQGYLSNGMADLSPTAGYEGNEPVQYADENDQQFTGRVADFELRRAHAEEIEAGGASQESEIKVLDAKYDVDVAQIKQRHERKANLRKESLAANTNVGPRKADK